MKTDYSHSCCFEQVKPACGQKIRHFECCICQTINPQCLSQFTQLVKEKLPSEMNVSIDIRHNIVREGYNAALADIKNSLKAAGINVDEI